MEINAKHVADPKLLDHEFQKLAVGRASEFKPALFESFRSALLHNFPFEDWVGRPVSDLYCATMGFLSFINERPKTSRLVDVYNPKLEKDGWLCGRTAVLVNCNDKPFLVDSVRMVLEEAEQAIHVSKSTILAVTRTNEGILQTVSAPNLDEGEQELETFAYFEITGINTERERNILKKNVEDSLKHVAGVVSGYAPMLAAVRSATDALSSLNEQTETVAFLQWLQSSNFTFLGFRSFNFDKPVKRNAKLKDVTLVEDVDKRLGIFTAIECETATIRSSDFPLGAKEFYASNEAVCFSKSNTRSKVHRNVYPDYVVVKRFNDKGDVIGECRFLGFFTYAVSSMSPNDIPILRQKVKTVLDFFGLNPRSHDGKRLVRAIDLHPKDEFFQTRTDELCAIFKRVVDLNERDIVRFIERFDHFGQFVSCLLYVPKDLYTTGLRLKIQALVGEALGTDSADITTFFSESKHARAHMIFRLPDTSEKPVSLAHLEPDIIELAHGWLEHFRKTLDERFGESKAGRFYKQYSTAFPQSYQEQFDARSAVNDIETFESLNASSTISMRLYQPVGSESDEIKFRIAHLHEMLELSDVIPILENYGLRVLGEQPYKITRRDNSVIWMHDFQLKSSRAGKLNIDEIQSHFEEAFEMAWSRAVESDTFNQLILMAGLDWRQVNLLRAYANYMKQTMFQISLEYIAETLVCFPNITRQLIGLFNQKFDPALHHDNQTRIKLSQKTTALIEAEIESIRILNQDKVIRRYLDFMNGTVRANYFQIKNKPTDTPYLSLKFNPSEIKDIPEPRPAFEFFVYCARVEGVHLRTSKVARGGLRWSDRQEDYRTEVLGLVKAQQVKNAVIVPSGAKGGFVAKQLPVNSTRAVFLAEGVECYKIFIRGLLDLTDNLIDHELTKPKNVVCLDGDDPYLVVAADKGTATFSDIANEISIEKGHWLGDAFASGGSQGYDHKGMGITAKGAWVSVQRHFRELGINTQADAFTVIGIGDMAGDVFGNGMLLSETIKLVAAFNHLHIFIDPDPDTAKSYAERTRLFGTQGSAWTDYDVSLISKGGGVFNRSDKYIELSPQLKSLVGSNQNRLTPNDLISLLLKAKIDLIWNGGIGTYVKSSAETHAEVGDKANDCLRVNGSELQCRVFGEGGNLGLTQRGRIEYAMSGGFCNTDFIDNAAGVDCSDHEVNIKILIDAQVQSGDLTEKQRNALLVEMTESVSDLVLNNNYRQTQALSIAEHQIAFRMNEYRRFINYLEELGRLDRSLEHLPVDSEIVDRIGKGQVLTRPELSVLISYAKVQLKEILAKSNIADDIQCASSLFEVFPPVLKQRYSTQIAEHKLRKEIIATELANDFINGLGITSLHRLSETTGATPEDIVKAYVAAKGIFRLDDFVQCISDLDYKIPASEQYELIAAMARRVRRGTRWFLKNRRSGLDVAREVKNFQSKLQAVQHAVGSLLVDDEKALRQIRAEELQDFGIDEQWVDVLIMPDNLFSGMGVVEVANTSKASVAHSTEVFIALMNRLKLGWFASQLSDIRVESYWQANAREAFIDDLEAQLRKLSALLLKQGAKNQDVESILDTWLEKNAAMVLRWTNMVNKVEATSKTDYAMFSVALKELNDLVQVTMHG